MIFDTVFMIRNGEFGTDFETKFFLVILGIGICFYDWYSHGKRKDYFWVFIVGTIIWTLTEFSQQSSGVREMAAGTLFGVQLPRIVSNIIQGSSEGAFIAIMGLFVADRLLEHDKRQKVLAIVFYSGFILYTIIGTALQAVSFKDVGASVASRRDMLAPMALVFLSSCLALIIIFLMKYPYPAVKKRCICMLAIMAIFATIWTISDVLANTRWIEVGTFGTSTEAPPLIEFSALAWDVLVEIAGAYVPFLIIPYLFKLIKNPEHRIPGAEVPNLDSKIETDAQVAA